MRVVAIALTMMLVATGCSHEQLDWQNATVSGDQIMHQDADVAFTGYLNNVPESVVYGWAPSIGNTIIGVLKIGYLPSDNIYCHGYVKNGHPDGEFVCGENGKEWTRIAFDDGVAKGSFQIWALDWSTDGPMFEGKLENGIVSGKFVQNDRKGDTMKTWTFQEN